MTEDLVLDADVNSPELENFLARHAVDKVAECDAEEMRSWLEYQAVWAKEIASPSGEAIADSLQEMEESGELCGFAGWQAGMLMLELRVKVATDDAMRRAGVSFLD